jgi:hypothetical protein
MTDADEKLPTPRVPRSLDPQPTATGLRIERGVKAEVLTSFKAQLPRELNI